MRVRNANAVYELKLARDVNNKRVFLGMPKERGWDCCSITMANLCLVTKAGSTPTLCLRRMVQMAGGGGSCIHPHLDGTSLEIAPILRLASHQKAPEGAPSLSLCHPGFHYLGR